MCKKVFVLRKMQLFVINVIVLSVFVPTINSNLTPHKIALHNYPVQEHIVHTSDGYLLNIYRIPAPATQTHSLPTKRSKVVLLQHGFTLSSDIWLLRGPSADLPYLLADAGYDVWLGNHRGNHYGRRHATLDPKIDRQHFWNFTWHEMGYFDLANTVDYILGETGQKTMHYVGYSQGGMVALVLLATRPDYAAKFKSLQFTAPTVYMGNINVPLPMTWRHKLSEYMGRLLDWWGYAETLHFAHWNAHQRLCKTLCDDGAWFRPIYLKVYGMIAGPVAAEEDYEHILTDMCGTLPVGASNKQLLHYIQLHTSGGFQQFDYGSVDKNRRQYGLTSPPSYNLSSIRNCVTLYYSETDSMSAAEDVRQLGKELPCAKLYPLPHAAWNHGDFMWSRYAPEALHGRILGNMNAWEASEEERMKN
ncbi:lipase 3-like [Rhagoletis pomonella]|uniref:lipase 3-like n=1 Tax=Rhagoletis pomonella TaxID=28610 RepID=UPI0017842732|nr:lipase 3-like [Rhagoletis pomonella]